MRNLNTHFTLLIATILFFNSAHATQIHVPADASTIQSGINLSVNGDTVIVAPGEYFENINLMGKNIVLTSNYYSTFDFNDIANTIINGSTPTNPDTASVILIISGEDANCIIQGFTITGGQGTKWLDEYGAGTYREGGGILMQYASPVIRYNYIYNNHITNLAGVSGAGGGAMRCGDGSPFIFNNIISYNEAISYGGGLVFNYCEHPVVHNNLIIYNTGGETYGGGGIWASGTIAQSLDVVNNTIAHNSSIGAGTFGGRGGGIFSFSVTVNISNSIIWDNAQSTGNPVYTSGGLFTFDYTDVDQVATGDGNINLDPLFLDTISCFLTDTISPCVDAGNPAPLFNDPEDLLKPGFALYPSLGTLRNDMGVYGGIFRMQISMCPEIIPTVDIETLIQSEIAVYPNPTHENITIQTNGIFKLTIINLTGEVVYQNNTFANVITINTSNWPSEIYVYQMRTQNGDLSCGKFIKE